MIKKLLCIIMLGLGSAAPQYGQVVIYGKLTDKEQGTPISYVQVVLYRYNNQPDFKTATLVFLYFPSWRSGAKDKPYLDDLLARLAHPPGSAPAASAAGSAASK